VVNVHDVHENISALMLLPRGRFSQKGLATAASLAAEDPEASSVYDRRAGLADGADAHAAAQVAPTRAAFAPDTQSGSDGASGSGRRLNGKARLSFAALRTPDRETCERFIESSPLCAGLGGGVPAGDVDVERLEDVSTGDWGLGVLVKVGEAWAPALLTMSECDRARCRAPLCLSGQSLRLLTCTRAQLAPTGPHIVELTAIFDLQGDAKAAAAEALRVPARESVPSAHRG
jgi:hypothetical protein